MPTATEHNMMLIIPEFYPEAGGKYYHDAGNMEEARDFADRMRELCKGHDIVVEQRNTRVWMTVN